MKNILVIDDSPEIRALVVATLIASGYGVRQAANGHQGIQIVIEQKPDLILCDVKMPALDGYHTLEAIRKCAGTAAIPFILMTGSMGPEDFRRGMASGADDYLTKPFTPEELIATVKSRLSRQTDIQTDLFRRAERQQLEAFRQLYAELSVPLIALADPATISQAVPAIVQNENSLFPQLQPVFCLD